MVTFMKVVRCEEGSEWCARVHTYLASRGAKVHAFPDHVVAARQHLHHHHALVRLQLLGYFAAALGRKVGGADGGEELGLGGVRYMVVVDETEILFQRNPFSVLDTSVDLHLLGAASRGGEVSGARSCAHAAAEGTGSGTAPLPDWMAGSPQERGGTGPLPDWMGPPQDQRMGPPQDQASPPRDGAVGEAGLHQLLSAGVLAGTPEAVVRHAGQQLLLAAKLVMAAGVSCCLPPEAFATWLHR
ncbi:hypothetical protein T484DRAFT_1808389 [Baffinella frigidus]|nr:hypothetical protein T484DRAFT_1808389 [Cryptophyta sp. CCMP2293]